MATNSRYDQKCPLQPELTIRQYVWQQWKRGESDAQIAARLGDEFTKDKVKNIRHGSPEYRQSREQPQERNPSATRGERLDLERIESDKKTGEINWRTLGKKADEMIELRRRASFSQDEATFSFPEATGPIAVCCLSDLHWGSYGTRHSIIEQVTDEILSIPELYVLALGDLEHLAIKLRGVMEVTDNVLTPELQHAFTESWLDEVGPRIIAAVWDNHSVMREENQAGSSQYKRIMSRKVIYHNGIGHLDVVVGKQRYRIAASHFFRGRSELHILHGQKKYMRLVAQDREIAVAGDSHVPAIEKYLDGMKVRMAANVGTAQLDSGYGKRFFSLKTLPSFPVFTLHPDEHLFIPFFSLEEYLRYRG